MLHTPSSSSQRIRSVCVYCGSGPGTDPAFAAGAYAFGQDLAENDVRLVYGGGGLGLMGTVARGASENGGKVLGIIPEFLKERENMYLGATEHIITDDMHSRKKLMYEHADAFVALPGGIGTLEELVEQLTWSQLGQHRKPIALLNTKGFWDPFLTLIDHMRQYAFIRAGLEVGFIVVDEPNDLLPALEGFAVSAEMPAVGAGKGFLPEQF